MGHSLLGPALVRSSESSCPMAASLGTVPDVSPPNMQCRPPSLLSRFPTNVIIAVRQCKKTAPWYWVRSQSHGPEARFHLLLRLKLSSSMQPWVPTPPANVQAVCLPPGCTVFCQGTSGTLQSHRVQCGREWLDQAIYLNQPRRLSRIVFPSRRI